MRHKSHNKYQAKRAVCKQGHTHDSQKEAKRCNELHLLAQGGEISQLEMQKKYILLPKAAYAKPTKNERGIAYVADFVYYDNTLGKTVVEDVKGIRTKEYILKRKLFKHLYCNHDVAFIET